MKNVILELTRIVQNVALVESPSEQVKLIVDSISEVIGVDVCSLYRLVEGNGMLLLASHGLDYGDNITIPAGKGLVGLVAKNRHPINVANAAKHADYFYIRQTHEEKFKSFCGVPLVNLGEVIGVLVVQSTRARAISKHNEAFLVTLASQLALLVSNLPTTIQQAPLCNQYVKGVKGAPGVGVGVALFTGVNELRDVPTGVCEDIDKAIIHWHKLLHKVTVEITAEKHALEGDLAESVAGIFDVYHMLLADHSLIDKVETEIRAGHWLPGALKLSIHYFAELFRVMDDPYLRARHEDIQHLGNKLYNAWRGSETTRSAKALGEGPVILVGSQVSISEIASIPSEQLAGIVSFEGSSLSHTAVVANALGVPAVMGTGMIKALCDGDQLIVDGTEGKVILEPSDTVAAAYRKLIDKERQLHEKLDELRDKPAQTTDGQRIRLLTNTGLMTDISPGLRNGAEGIGLYRTELTFMVRDSFPSEDEQVQAYQRVFAAYENKPIYMRTLDIGGDKQLAYFPIENEENPALGWRGIRFTLDNIQLLMTQVRAMIRAAKGADNLHILLPMISSTHELDTFKELLDDACQQLQQEGIVFCRPKVGIMVEVPAAISQLPFWQDKIDFVSIGSNDLSQYLLATDRNNAHVAGLFDHLHPAVLHEVQRIVNTAKQYNLPLSLCGEMASDPVAVILLLAMGVRTLSMSAAKLPRIKGLIRSLSIVETEELLARALSIDNAKDVRSLVGERMDALGWSLLL